ncbi:uridine kinase family protein [Reichenbachiella versicolor]|uniref:uridine kinase family protein n=1 Tax=Reichenbachiella versicolor TaxID=1821036 RepID=UPI000D6E0928|nr:uridine kinase [Reichenbachiella versicolor]
MNRPIIIGLTGGSGSGKTFILHLLKQALGEEKVTVLSQDNYYKPIEEQTKDDQGIENFDLPSAINHDAFANDLKKLIKGEPVILEEYTFNNKESKPNHIHISSKPIIIVEGLFVFYHTQISKQMDITVYIDCPKNVMVERRIKRDAVERGYDLNDVKYRFEHHVWPTYEKYVLPSRESADIVIDNSENDNKIDFSSSLDKLKSQLELLEV